MLLWPHCCSTLHSKLREGRTRVRPSSPRESASGSNVRGQPGSESPFWSPTTFASWMRRNCRPRYSSACYGIREYTSCGHCPACTSQPRNGNPPRRISATKNLTPTFGELSIAVIILFGRKGTHIRTLTFANGSTNALMLPADRMGDRSTHLRPPAPLVSATVGGDEAHSARKFSPNVNDGACVCAEPSTTASSWTSRCSPVCGAVQFFTGMTVSSSCVYPRTSTGSALNT